MRHRLRIGCGSWDMSRRTSQNSHHPKSPAPEMQFITHSHPNYNNSLRSSAITFRAEFKTASVLKTEIDSNQTRHVRSFLIRSGICTQVGLPRKRVIYDTLSSMLLFNGQFCQNQENKWCLLVWALQEWLSANSKRYRNQGRESFNSWRGRGRSNNVWL